MDRVITIIFVIFVIFTGLNTIPVCIEYLTTHSSEIGKVDDLVKSDLTDQKDCYTITYDLAGGLILNPQINGQSAGKENPTTYTLFTESFTLVNPEKDGYDFIGWTGTELEEPRLKVTICKGSSGNLEFKAHYEKILDAPVLNAPTDTDGLRVSWNKIDNATGYVVNVNGVDCIKASFTSETISSNYLKVGDNVIKVKASRDNYSKFSPWSNSVSYSIVNQLEPIELTYSNNVFSFNAVDNAWEYVITAGNCTFSLSASKTTFPNNCITLNNGNYTIDLTKAYEKGDVDIIDGLLYSPDNNEYINSANHSINVTVTANATFKALTAPAVSNSVSYVYDIAVNLNKLTYTSTTYTHSQLGAKYSQYDVNSGAFLAILLPTTFFNNDSIPESVYSYCSDLVMEIYVNNSLLTTVTAKKYAGSYLYNFKSNELTVNKNYTCKLMFKSNNTKIEKTKTLNITCLDSNHLIFLEFKTV